MKKLSRELVEFLCSINSRNTIDVLSLVLFWLKLGFFLNQTMMKMKIMMILY